MPSKASQGSTPKNWPPNLPYLTASTLSPTLSKTTLQALSTPPSSSTSTAIYQIPTSHPKGPCQLVKITPMNSPTHPANGQSGLFATRHLSPGEFILPYLGVIHASSSLGSENGGDSRKVDDPHAHSDYDLSLDRYLGVGIDAAEMGNEARFINDFRGVAERCNAEFKEVWDERFKRKGMGVFVLGVGKGTAKANGKAKFKGVAKGEEILVSYGRGFWGARREEEAVVEDNQEDLNEGR